MHTERSFVTCFVVPLCSTTTRSVSQRPASTALSMRPRAGRPATPTRGTLEVVAKFSEKIFITMGHPTQ